MSFLIHATRSGKWLKLKSMHQDVRDVWVDDIQSAKRYQTAIDAQEEINLLSSTANASIVMDDGKSLWNVFPTKVKKMY